MRFPPAVRDDYSARVNICIKIRNFRVRNYGSTPSFTPLLRNLAVHCRVTCRNKSGNIKVLSFRLRIFVTQVQIKQAHGVGIACHKQKTEHSPVSYITQK